MKKQFVSVLMISLICSTVFAQSNKEKCEAEYAHQSEVQEALAAYKKNCGRFPAKLTQLLRAPKKCQVHFKNKAEMNEILKGYSYNPKSGSISPLDCPI